MGGSHSDVQIFVVQQLQQHLHTAAVSESHEQAVLVLWAEGPWWTARERERSLFECADVYNATWWRC